MPFFFWILFELNFIEIMNVKNDYSFESLDEAQDTEIGEKHTSFNLPDIRNVVIVISV